MKQLYLILICIPLLTGCWDQTLLKNSRLVYSAAFDLTDDNQVESTLTIRTISGEGVTTTGTHVVNEVLTVRGNTVRQTRREIDRQLSGEFSGVKNRTFILGEEIAKTDIYDIFDIFYRDTRSPLGAQIMIAQGKGGDVLRMNRIGETLIGEYLYELYDDGVILGLIPDVNIQDICTWMFDPGKDFALPYLKYEEENNRYAIEGVGLIHDRAFTGEVISGEQATLLLLLQGKKAKIMRFTKKVHHDEDDAVLKVRDHITVQVAGMKHKMKVKAATPADISVKIDVGMKVTVNEYPRDKLSTEKVRKELERKLTNMMTAEANAIVKKVQEANSDVFGIGRELMAYHPDIYKRLDWEKDYQKITIIPNVKVEIVGTGAIS